MFLRVEGRRPYPLGFGVKEFRLDVAPKTTGRTDLDSYEGRKARLISLADFLEGQ